MSGISRHAGSVGGCLRANMSHPLFSSTSWYGVGVAGLYGVDVAGLYGVDVASQCPVGWCGVDVDGPTTLTLCTNVSGPAQVMPMSDALRLPSPSISSWEMMGCVWEASGRRGCPAGESRVVLRLTISYIRM